MVLPARLELACPFTVTGLEDRSGTGANSCFFSFLFGVSPGGALRFSMLCKLRIYSLPHTSRRRASFLERYDVSCDIDGNALHISVTQRLACAWTNSRSDDLLFEMAPCDQVQDFQCSNNPCNAYRRTILYVYEPSTHVDILPAVPG